MAPQLPHSPVHIDIGQNYDGSVGYQSHHGDSRNDQHYKSDNYQNHHGANNNDQNDESNNYQSNHGASNPKSPPVSSHSTEYPASFLNIDD